MIEEVGVLEVQVSNIIIFLGFAFDLKNKEGYTSFWSDYTSTGFRKFKFNEHSFLVQTFIVKYIKANMDEVLLSHVDLGRLLLAHEIVDSGSHLLEVVFEVAELNIEIVAAFFEGNEPKNVQTLIGIFKGKTIFEVRRLFLAAFRQSSDRR